ncbi:CAS1 domain-containing protein 1 [Microtus ochrogaster]|uniref:CAS1 domain-containing protein 1 n=1 Tax=Microtus ochrogaster TaxID=79684 RepID=A0A8J6G8B7_MICOH|nr:CAS1 domain-containing protein 1 [Microtus ochrogaster]
MLGAQKPGSCQPDVQTAGKEDIQKQRKWSIKIHNGSEEALAQYRMNITSIAPLLEKLAKTSDVYWVLQDPVYEDLLSENRKMITNEKIDAYNEVAVSILNSSARNSKSNVKLFSVSKLIAQETIMESLDGLHLPESSRETSAMILMNVCCNKVLKPVDGSCCQPRPPLTLIQKLAACFFTLSIIGYLIFYAIHRNAHRKNKPCTDLESGEEKKTLLNTPVSSLETLLQSFCKLGLIMAYFYMCDRANLFMKENKFYTHSSFFIPIIYILVLGIFYNESTKETKVLNREQTDEWKGWMQLVILIYHISGASTPIKGMEATLGTIRGLTLALLNKRLQRAELAASADSRIATFVTGPFIAFLPVYMHIRVLVAAYLFQTGYGHFSYFWVKGDFGIHRVCQVVFHGMLFAFIYLALQRRQILSEGKGEPLFSNKISNFLLFISVVSFLTYSIWASSCKNKAECNELHPSVSVVQIVAFILIRNIPGYARSVYSSFFAWFGKISLELFICQYHIWLAADTRGILVLIPGNPTLNIIVSTFIFVCVAHEISQITTDLAQVLIPKDNPSLLRRLACTVAFFCGLLLLSSVQDK